MERLTLQALTYTHCGQVSSTCIGHARRERSAHRGSRRLDKDQDVEAQDAKDTAALQGCMWGPIPTDGSDSVTHVILDGSDSITYVVAPIALRSSPSLHA